MESGILELHKEVVPAQSLVQECITMFAVHARSKDIEVVPVFTAPLQGTVAADESGSSVVRALSDADTVWMDRFKMSQVLRNLLSNALKFTPQGGRVLVKAYIKVGRGVEGLSNAEGRGRSVRMVQSMSFWDNRKNKGKGKNAIHSVKGARVVVDGTHASATGEQSSDEGCFVVEVTDSGAGISKDNQAKLFREVSTVRDRAVHDMWIVVHCK